MTRLIVFVFAGIIEILAWLFLVVGMYAAYYFIPDGIFQHEFYQNREILKLAIGLLGTFFSGGYFILASTGSLGYSTIIKSD